MIKKTLLFLFFFSIFFPYISFGFKTSFDQQPWSLVLGAIYVIFISVKEKELKIKKDLILLYLVIFTMIANLLLDYLFLNYSLIRFLRASYKYFSFAIIIYLLINNIKQLKFKYVKVAVVLWAIIANLQAIFRVPLISFILPRVSYYSSRNLSIGFAPEPSFLAKMMFLFLLINTFFYLKGSIAKKEKIFVDLLCFELIILSQSLTGFFLIIIYFLIIAITHLVMMISRIRLKLTQIIGITAVLSLITVFHNNILKIVTKILLLGGRSKYLLRFFNFENGSFVNTLLVDKSFKRRLVHLYDPLNTLIDGHLLGIRLTEYSTGGILSVITENGILGVLFISLIVFIQIRSFAKVQINYKSRLFILSTSLFLPLLVFTDTIATPIFPTIIALLYCLGKSSNPLINENYNRNMQNILVNSQSVISRDI